MERLIYIVKSKLLATSFDLPKPSLNLRLKKLSGTSELQNKLQLAELRSRNSLIERQTTDEKI